MTCLLAGNISRFVASKPYTAETLVIVLKFEIVYNYFKLVVLQSHSVHISFILFYLSSAF